MGEKYHHDSWQTDNSERLVKNVFCNVGIIIITHVFIIGYRFFGRFFFSFTFIQNRPENTAFVRVIIYLVR